MAVPRKHTQEQELEDYHVLIKDDFPTSRYFRISEIPEKLTAGKNSFLIDGSPYLRDDTRVVVEVKDVNGNVIYSEVPDYLEGSRSRLVSIYIYDDTPAGEATITILGEATYSHEGYFIVPDWQNVYNVSWQKKINIDPLAQNRSKIRFAKMPIVSIEEVTGSYVEVRYPGNSYSGSSAGSLIPSSYITYTNGASPSTGIIYSHGFSMFADMEGGTLYINSASIQQLAESHGVSLDEYYSYTGSVINVLNDSSSVVYPSLQEEVAAKISDKRKANKIRSLIVPSFTSSKYDISYRNSPTSQSKSQDIQSYAKLTAKNLQTISGDVEILKVYGKSSGLAANWIHISDVTLDSQEHLIDTTDPLLNKRIGVFTDQSLIDTYWLSSVYESSSISINAPDLIYDNKSIIDGMLISGSADRITGDIFKVTHTTNMSSHEDHYYQVSLKLFGKNVPHGLGGAPPEFAQQNYDAHIVIYATGSAFPSIDPKGVKIAEFGVNPDDNFKNFGKVDRTFRSLADGDFKIAFYVLDGDWTLADISVRQAVDFGYSPDSADLYLPLAGWHRGDNIDFKVEFYNPAGEKSDITLYTELPSSFIGGNTYIAGSDNIITGSIYAGGGVGSGIEISATSASFIRSVGFNTMPLANAGSGKGFLFFSGSYISGYSGVGIEFNAGSGSAPGGYTHAIKARTSTGKVEITGSILATDLTVLSGSAGLSNPGLPTGSVLFQGTSGITGSDSSFFWDNINLRLGIGTNLPQRKLDIEGVGSNPQLRLSLGSAYAEVRATANGDLIFIPGSARMGIGSPLLQATVDIMGPPSSSIFRISNDLAREIFFVSGSGRVGVGTTIPIEALHVSGNIYITGGYRDSSGSFGTPGQILVSQGSGARWVNSSSIGTGLATTDDLAEGSIHLYSQWGETGSNIYYNSGSVGIATSNPQQRLEVAKSAVTQIRSSYLASSIYTDFGTTANGHFIIVPSGEYVGIGTELPIAKLDIVGASSASLLSVQSETYGSVLFVSGSARVGIKTTSPQSDLHVSGNVRIDGNLDIYGKLNELSDIRLKDNINLIHDPINKLKKLRGVSFDWNDKSIRCGTHDIGVIAQDVEQILPEAISQEINGFKMVNYSKLIPLLIEVVKLQQSTIEELQQSINNLKRK